MMRGQKAERRNQKCLHQVFLLSALCFLPLNAQSTIEIRKNGKVVASNQNDPANAVRVLFIGNSLTFWNELPWMTRRVAGSLGAQPPLVTEFSGMSGATLRQQWERGRALRAIRERRWNFVVLQPQSTEMIDRPGETMKYARLFDAEIDRVGARTVLFETWVPPARTITQAALTERYGSLAREISAVLAPIGTAWAELRRDGYDLFDPGGAHPNLRGSYLAACIFYATFYGKSPEGATHTFETKFDIPESYRRDLENDRIDSATAEVIQRAAFKVIK